MVPEWAMIQSAGLISRYGFKLFDAADNRLSCRTSGHDLNPPINATTAGQKITDPACPRRCDNSDSHTALAESASVAITPADDPS